MDREPPLSPTEFSSAVTAITSAFGDPTRREIYLFAHEQRPTGVTAAEVAERFDLHPNVARHHLDKLAGGGYLEVAVGRTGDAGAGRPSKRYRVDGDADRRSSSRSATTTCSSRCSAGRSPLLPAERGRGDGRGGRRRVRPGHGRGAWATPADGQRSFRTALHAVADALTAHGFAAHAEQHGDELRIVVRALPVRRRRHRAPGDLRRRPRAWCGACSARSTARPTAEPESSIPMGDDDCVTAIEA